MYVFIKWDEVSHINNNEWYESIMNESSEKNFIKFNREIRKNSTVWA